MVFILKGNISTPSPIDYEPIADFQNKDLSILKNNPKKKMVQIPIPDVKKSIYCDVYYTNSNRSYILSLIFRHQIFSSILTLSHPGLSSTRKLVKKRFIYKRLPIMV
ncbi:hypothetical protein CEXT_54171 [Caerostris extrusa]|uniref:Uncharacterized protein n=1 Tax=Caerostris extrusa TaxID=172846 RepID=A0AAV4TCW4_CAEEX|nr:hypothetical protein CEXT_54171 [Caerostris extrusa]